MTNEKTDPVHTFIRWIDGETGEQTLEAFDVTVFEDGTVDMSQSK